MEFVALAKTGGGSCLAQSRAALGEGLPCKRSREEGAKMKYFRLNYGQGCLGQVTAQEGGASSGLALGLPFQQQGSRGGSSRWQSLTGSCPGSSSTGKGPWSPKAEQGQRVGLNPSCSIPWPGCSLSWLPSLAQLSSFAVLWGPQGPSPAPTEFCGTQPGCRGGAGL